MSSYATPDLQQYSTEGTSLDEAVIRKATLACRDALARARYLQPYLANFVNRTQILQSESIGPTFAVTPDLILVYNPLFILGMNEQGEGMTPWEFGIAFLHESLHIVFKHQRRWETYRRKFKIELNQVNSIKWNIAADCEINVLLRKVHPVNPVYEHIAGAIYNRQAGMYDYRWETLTMKQRGEAVRTETEKVWNRLPKDKQYPPGMADDWPHEGVTLPPWFCFPETTLAPPQNDRGTAEDYYPFVKDPGQPQGPRPPKKKPKWEGFKVGERVVDKTTGEEAEIVWVGPYDPDASPPQEVRVTVTNHWTENGRTLEEATKIGAIARAKAAAGITPEKESEIRKKVRADNKKRAKQGAKGRQGYNPPGASSYTPMGSGVMKWTTVSGGVEHKKMQSSNGVYTIETLTGGGMPDEATTYLYKYVGGVAYKIEAGPMSGGWDGAGGWDVMTTHTEEEIMAAAEKDASGTATYTVVPGNPQIP